MHIDKKMKREVRNQLKDKQTEAQRLGKMHVTLIWNVHNQCYNQVKTTNEI